MLEVKARNRTKTRLDEHVERIMCYRDQHRTMQPQQPLMSPVIYALTMVSVRAANSHVVQSLKHTHLSVPAPIGVAAMPALRRLLLLLQLVRRLTRQLPGCIRLPSSSLNSSISQVTRI